jgi:hypothetical protein
MQCTPARGATAATAEPAMQDGQQSGAPPSSLAGGGVGRGGDAAARACTARAAAAGAHLQRMLQAGHFTKPDAIVR